MGRSTQDGRNVVRRGGLVAVASIAMVSAHALGADAVKDIVTPEGVFTVRVADAPDGWSSAGPLAGSGGWFFDTGFSIGHRVALSPAHTWAGVQLNSPRMLAFESAGDGTPIYEVAAGHGTVTGVAASKTVDRAAFLDRDGATGPFRVRVYSSASDVPQWTYEFDTNFTSSNRRMVAVSRDGSVVAAAARDPNLPQNLVVFFNGTDGSIISSWTQPDGGLGALQLTDDGSIAMVSIGNQPRVVDTATGTLIWGGTGSGAGNVDYRISGDGGIIAVGGFSLQIYEWTGSTYAQIINFATPPTEWFGFGLAVSRDGSTVGSMSRESATNILHVRMWDVATATMIGQVTMPAVFDTLQTTPQGADSTDDGSLFAFATWGDGFGVYPEVQVYDRDLNLVAEIDMPGSANDVAISPTGKWVAGTGKAIHANTSGNGGQVVVIELDVDAPCPGDLTGDGNVGVADLLDLLAAWGPNPGHPADLTGDGNVGVADLLELLAAWGPCP